MNILSLAKSRKQNNGTIYLEDPYDKLKTKLVDGEFLYLYTQNVLSDNIISITYHNIKNPKNDHKIITANPHLLSSPPVKEVTKP